MATTSADDTGNTSLFNDSTLSDVSIRFGGQRIFAHKAILARKSRYFLKAFTGGFPVATSKEIDLGDDDDPEAIHAMIRHIYDLQYDQMIEEDTKDDKAAHSTNEDLMFHINVFTTADKYDVATLRPKVVTKFKDLMQTTWESDQFAPSIQKLCGPSAGHLADNSLQAAAAAFCADNLSKLIKQDTFARMIEEEPFAGRLLTNFFASGKRRTHMATLWMCHQKGCRTKFEQQETPLIPSDLPGDQCVFCGLRWGTQHSSRRHSYNEVYTTLQYYKKVEVMML